MAKILARNNQKLVVALFGRRIEITHDGGTASTGQTETVPRIQEVFGQGLAWFQAGSGARSEFGPLFGENLRFWGTGTGTACYATHDGNLGLREVPSELQYVLGEALNWLG